MQWMPGITLNRRIQPGFPTGSGVRNTAVLRQSNDLYASILGEQQCASPGLSIMAYTVGRLVSKTSANQVMLPQGRRSAGRLTTAAMNSRSANVKSVRFAPTGLSPLAGNICQIDSMGSGQVTGPERVGTGYTVIWVVSCVLLV